MQRHVAADVDIHTTDELSLLLGNDIAEREQLRVWPLSSVELLTTADGSKHIYKAQRLLTVEPTFYLAAGPVPLLPGCRVLTHTDDSSTLVLEFLGSPVTLAGEPEAAVVEVARSVVDAIGSLPIDLPSFVAIDTPERFAHEVDWTLVGLWQLIADGRFTGIDESVVNFVEQWARGPDIVETIATTSRLTNGDLKFDQVFRGPDGPRVVDWQVPARAPADVDLVMLLEDRGIPPLRYVHPAVVGIRWFLMLRWAVFSKLELIPEMPRLFDKWAADAIEMIRLAANHRR